MEIKLYKCDEVLCIADDDEGCIGEGSFGKVRLGFHENTRAIAVKCSEMKGGIQEKKLLEKKFKKEIGHLQQAKHENIVRVYGWTHWPGAVAIIMEYLPAGNLKAILLDEEIVLGPLLKARFGAEIANGLAFIHNLFDDKRLLHGDIKPENILMTEDLHCKIGDFGAAQLSNYTCTAAPADRQNARSVQFTSQYAAPERLQDISTKLTSKCDTYSYGMTLYMILSGVMPLDIGVPEEVFTDGIIKGQRPSVQNIQDYKSRLTSEGECGYASIIGFLEDKMTRCWQQNPADRPTMIDVINQLQTEMADHRSSEVHQQVFDALKSLSVGKPLYVQDECVPASSMRPPDFTGPKTERSDAEQIYENDQGRNGWSKCSHSCGAGNQQRQRYVINEAQHGGLPCPEKYAMRETQICTLKDCTVDCQVSEWSSWSKCSHSCDIGNQQRQKYVIKEAQHGGLPCPEEQSMKEMRTCTMMDCPMDCEISEWSSWSACSQSCGDGRQERRRHISRPLQYGEVPCPDAKKLKE
ncbi:unnamed protein product, partial [Clavelina lepadiformis]